MDLTEFLRARLDEDERIAKAGSEPGGPHWPNSDSEIRTPQMEHARRHDPSRVLAEVEAKRRVLGWAETGALPEYEVTYVLTALALPYADHPDYRDEWRP